MRDMQGILIMNFHLNKTSLLVTVPADSKLPDLKNRLAGKGLFLGYAPLDDDSHPLEHYFKHRIPNFYHFKYGSLADLVSSCVFELHNNKTFHIKDSPRSAIGPDFNRMVIGSGELFGKAKQLTLKLSLQPERTVRGILCVNSLQDARHMLRHMMQNFIFPLYFFYLSFETGETVMKFLPEADSRADALVTCLSGPANIIKAQQTVIDEHCQKKRFHTIWWDRKKDAHRIERTVYRKENFDEIKKQYKNFLWPPAQNEPHSALERDFLAGLFD